MAVQDGNTALIIAAMQREVEIARFLIEARAHLEFPGYVRMLRGRRHAVSMWLCVLSPLRGVCVGGADWQDRTDGLSHEPVGPGHPYCGVAAGRRCERRRARRRKSMSAIRMYWGFFSVYHILPCQWVLRA